MSQQSPAPSDAPPANGASARHEGQFHSYVSNRIPWYVRLLWLLFWVFAVAYVIRYLFPALQIEISSPP